MPRDVHARGDGQVNAIQHGLDVDVDEFAAGVLGERRHASLLRGQQLVVLHGKVEVAVDGGESEVTLKR